MFDFLIGTEQYPKKAEWLQLIKPESVDDVKTFEGAVIFQYRVLRKASNSAQDINGLKMIKQGLYIATKDDLPFAKGDIIIINNKTYTIQNANQIENMLLEKSRIIYEHFNDYETEIEIA